MNKFIAFPLFGLLVLCGCNNQSAQPGAASPSAQSSAQKAPSAPAQAAASETPKFQPFIIYKDKGTRENHFIPSGFMPDGQCLTFDDIHQQDCHDGKTCIKIAYDVACSREGQKWAGVYWLNPANNWGNRKGGFNLIGAEKLTFWAKGEKGGERIEEFKMGGIAGDFPDTDMAVIGPVILTNQWAQYTIDLRGKDLSYVSGGFSWSTNVDVNPENCTFYLDDMQYE